MAAKQFQVPQELDGRTAIDVLRRLFRTKHPSYAEKILRQKRVLTEGRALDRDEKLAAGQTLELTERIGEPNPPQANRKIRLFVRHEDEHLLVLSKAAGIPMHPGAGHGTDTLLNGLVGRYPELLSLGPPLGYGMVHRLDRDTSGLVIVARTPEAYEGLRTQFSDRKVSKIYLALCHGSLEKDEGMLGREVQGKSARTDFRVIERFESATLVEARPVTGRMHQIRIHFSSISHPLVGEKRYERDVSKHQDIRVPRLFLHARDLTFKHPSTGETVHLQEPLPKDLERTLRRLRKKRDSQD